MKYLLIIFLLCASSWPQTAVLPRTAVLPATSILSSSSSSPLFLLEDGADLLEEDGADFLLD